jgi:hypothetical protein
VLGKHGKAGLEKTVNSDWKEWQIFAGKYRKAWPGKDDKLR